MWLDLAADPVPNHSCCFSPQPSVPGNLQGWGDMLACFWGAKPAHAALSSANVSAGSVTQARAVTRLCAFARALLQEYIVGVGHTWAGGSNLPHALVPLDGGAVHGGLQSPKRRGKSKFGELPSASLCVQARVSLFCRLLQESLLFNLEGIFMRCNGQHSSKS